MRERLREINELLTAAAGLFRKESQVIGVAEHLFEVKPRRLEIARARHALDIPEGTHVEGALGALQSIDPVPFEYLWTKLSSISFSPTAFSVDSHRGSVGLMNRTRGIIRQDASNSEEPLLCTKLPSFLFQKSLWMLLYISSRLLLQRTKGAGKLRFLASLIARSRATQHMSRECRNFFLVPRISHIP